MGLRVEHELHRRRASRNLGLLAVLIAFAAIVFGLTIAKVERGDNMKAWDQRIDRGLEPGAAGPLTPRPDVAATAPAAATPAPAGGPAPATPPAAAPVTP